MRRLALAVVLVLVLVVPFGCLEPTEVDLEITTIGVDCTKTNTTAIAIAPYGVDPATLTTPNTTTTACKGDRIGNIVITPSQAPRILVRVTAALDGTPIENCLAQKHLPMDSCVDARRVVSFVRHSKSTVPVVINRACANVDCGPDATCENGTCVSTLPCDGGTCPPEDAGGPARQITKVKVGGLHACALVSDGGLWCWGNNMVGQLGLGTNDIGVHALPNKVPLEAPATDFWLGFTNTCALLANNKFQCWGSNLQRQLGVPNANDATCVFYQAPQPCRTGPTTVPTITNVKAAAIGLSHACAIVDSNGQSQLYCWGGNVHGQLGHDPATDAATCSSSPCSETPTLVPVQNPAQVFAGVGHTFVKTGSGTSTIVGFGGNAFGELGTGMSDTTAHFMPMPIAVKGGGNLVTSASAYFGCVQSASDITCWGANDHAQVTFPVSMLVKPTQRIFDVNQGALDEIGVGGASVCVRGSGAIQCWGASFAGTLGHDPGPDSGNAGDQYSPSPQHVMGADGAIQLSVGGYTACILRADGKVLCWGRNANGECGHDPTADSLVFSGGLRGSFTPTIVKGFGGL